MGARDRPALSSDPRIDVESLLRFESSSAVVTDEVHARLGRPADHAPNRLKRRSDFKCVRRGVREPDPVHARVVEVAGTLAQQLLEGRPGARRHEEGEHDDLATTSKLIGAGGSALVPVEYADAGLAVLVGPQRPPVSPQRLRMRLGCDNQRRRAIDGVQHAVDSLCGLRTNPPRIVDGRPPSLELGHVEQCPVESSGPKRDLRPEDSGASSQIRGRVRNDDSLGSRSGHCSKLLNDQLAAAHVAAHEPAASPLPEGDQASKRWRDRRGPSPRNSRGRHRTTVRSERTPLQGGGQLGRARRTGRGEETTQH